jgi:hypothetical protein
LNFFEYKKVLVQNNQTSFFWELCEEVEKQIEIIYFLISISQQQDKGQLIAALALSQIKEVEDEKVSRYKSSEDIINESLTEGPATKVFIRLAEDLYRNMFVRNMESFETFLSDLLSDIYIKNPNMLKSKETITLDEVLHFEDKVELIKYVTESRVMKLQMQGHRALSKYLSERHGLSWFNEQDELVLSKAISIRNLIVHNKSRVNYQFLKLNKDMQLKIGDVFNVKKIADEIVINILKISSNIDNITSKKFDMPVVSFQHHKEKA